MAHPLHALGFEACTPGSQQLQPEPTQPQPEKQPEPIPSKNGGARRIVKGAVVKGSRVRLADGAVARVVWVDPNMRIARVRTDDGRNITVRH